MLKVVILSVLCGLVFSYGIEKPKYIIEHAEYYFNDFVITYNRIYATEDERQERLRIFTENLVKINERNSIDSAVHGVNHFTDLTIEEFSQMYTGFKPSLQDFAICNEITDQDLPDTDTPEAFDWREKNVITPVKNQGHCGSCYAFSAAGNIEAQYAIKNGGNLLDLSEQQLVSCSTTNDKCEGGSMTGSMQDVMNMGGIELERDYPYVNYGNNDSHPCHFNKALTKVALSGCISYKMQDENKLKVALLKYGPISVGVAAQALMTYTRGVLMDCPGTYLDVDHAVLLIGYGIDNEKGPYWTFKNSWGNHFGEQGYFRVVRGNNPCAMMNPYLSSAIVA